MDMTRLIPTPLIFGLLVGAGVGVGIAPTATAMQGDPAAPIKAETDAMKAAKKLAEPDKLDLKTQKLAEVDKLDLKPMKLAGPDRLETKALKLADGPRKIIGDRPMKLAIGMASPLDLDDRADDLY